MLRLLVCLIMVLPVPSANAQGLPCGPREQVLRALMDGLGERRQALGYMARGVQMELFSAESGAWTIVLHLPDGRSCLLAHGDGFAPTGGLQPALGRPV